MGREELRTVSKDGVVLGSHGLTHKLLAALPLEECRHELESSKKLIEKAIDCPVDFVSVPEGSWNKTVKKAAKEAGYKFMFTSDAGYNSFRKAEFLLKRFVIRGDYTMAEFKKIIEGDRCFLLHAKIKQFVSNAARSFLGVEKYKRLKNSLIGINRKFGKC